jgi:hypothetical protein
MENLLLLFFTLLISVPLMLWRAFVITVLWGWFIVPQFAISQLGMINAIGLSLVVSLLTARLSKVDSDDDERNKTLAGQIAVGIVAPAMALLYGWIVVQFR